MQFVVCKMVLASIEGLMTLAESEMAKGRCSAKWVRVLKAACELGEAIKDVARHY